MDDGTETRFNWKIEALPTHVQNNGNEYWLLGLEDRDSVDHWKFDVRISMEEES